MISRLLTIAASAGLVLAGVQTAAAQSISLHVDRNCKGPALSTTVANEDVSYPVDSIRVRSGEWEVCRNSGFRNCVEVDKTGCSNLNEIQFWGQVRSVRPRVKASPEAEAIFYRDRGFSGPAVFIKSAKPDMDWMGHGISSIRVKKGRWQVCMNPNYQSPCRVVSKDTTNIAAIGLPSIGSIRPAPSEDAAAPEPAAKLYLASKCSGPGRTKHSGDPDVNYPTRAIEITAGVWEACSQLNYGGICKRLVPGCTAREDFGFFGQVRSIRPVAAAGQKPQPK